MLEGSSQRLNKPVDIVKRRYESIRTQYSKYLRARKGAPGCGYDDIPHSAKFEHLQWLKTFIISRTSTTNLKVKYPSNQPSQHLHQYQCVDSLSGEIYDEDGHDSITDWNEYEELVPQGQSINAGLQTSNATSDNEGESTTESAQSVSTGTPKVATAAPKKKAWVKTESRKRQLERTNEELSNAMQNLTNSLMRSAQQRSNKLEATELDEDHYYGMSIASRLRRLDRMKKAMVRNAIEKVFLDIELGFYNNNPLSAYEQHTT